MNSNLQQPLDEILLRVKTIDGNTLEVRVHLTQTIYDLKSQISQLCGVPAIRQRLIYKGRPMNNDETILSYKMEDHQVVHLVANVIDPEGSPSVQGGFSISSLDDHETRARDDVQESRKLSRRKVLQQRLHGFPNLPPKPSPALQQNVMTLCHLIQSANNLQEVIEQGYIFTQKEFEVGMWVDYRDVNEWVEAQIVAKQQNQICLRIDKLEEWVAVASPRLAVFRQHTIQKTYHLSPTITNCEQQHYMGFGEILGHCSMLLTRVGTMMGRLADQMEEKTNIQNPKQKSDMSTLINGMIEEQRRFQEDKTEKEDVTSLKSMKSMKSDKISIDYETSSIKSMKSDVSKLTQFLSSYHNHHPKENITEEEEDSQDIEERDAVNNSKDSKENIQHFETVLLAAQVAPLTDRLGRLLIDLSPYLAMSGSNINNIVQSHYTNNISNLSIVTNEGSQHSTNHRPYYFQIPILLTPLELAQQQAGISRIVGDNVEIIHNNASHKKRLSRVEEEKAQTQQQQQQQQQQQPNQLQKTERFRSSMQNSQSEHLDELDEQKEDKKKQKKKQKEVSFSQQFEDLKHNKFK